MNKKILFVFVDKFKNYPVLYEYCVGLQRLGNEITYIGRDEEDKSFVDESGIKVFNIGRNTAPNNAKFAIRSAALARQLNPDLIHVFHFRGCFLLPLKSFFFTDFILDVRTVHVTNKHGKHSLLTPLKNCFTWFESQFFRYAIALTPQIKKLLSPSFKEIPVIPLGASISRFRPADKHIRRSAIRNEIGLTDSDILFLYAGTLSPIRKIDIVLDAFGDLYKINPRAHLAIVGNDRDNPDTLAKLIDASKKKGCDDRVHFTGFLAYEQLVNYFLAADIGICYIPQTKYYDQQPPTKLFEYMAAEQVVIATRTSANQQIIKDGINGYLCGDDSNSLYQSMSWVCDSLHSIKERIITEADKVVEMYSWNKIIENQLLTFYRTIFNRRSIKNK